MSDPYLSRRVRCRGDACVALGLDVVIQGELVGVRAEPDRVRFELALVRDVVFELRFSW